MNVRGLLSCMGTAAAIGALLFIFADLSIYMEESGGTVESDKAEERIGDVIRGRIVYEQYCIACHQADGKGANGMIAADLTNKDRMTKSNDELLTSIRDGFQGKVGLMPPWKDILSESDMEDVLQYIRDTFVNQ